MEELNGVYFDATIDNFKGVLKKYPNLRVAWNIISAIKFETYLFIHNGILEWSHYRSIGDLSNNGANKNLKKVKFIDGELVFLKEFDRSRSSRGKPFYWFKGKKFFSHSGYIDNTDNIESLKILLIGRLEMRKDK